jgi:hypothetical protein
MVGIYKKFKLLTKAAKKYAPYLNNLTPGLGDLAGLSLTAIDKGGDFINAFHEGYKSTKGKRFKRFTQGLKSGLSSIADLKTRDIGELSEKIELNNNEETAGDSE